MSDPTQPPVDPTNSAPATPPAASSYPAQSYPTPSTPIAPDGQAPAYGEAPAYGQNPYKQQNPHDKYNVLSIISLVTSILAISIAGIITGHIAMSQIKKTGEKGYNLALWGLIVGYLGLVVGTVVVVGLIAVTIAAVRSGLSYY
jgi:hypothetical protein